MNELKCKIIVCENVHMENTNKGFLNSIMNPLQVIEPINIPCNYTFVVACNFTNIDRNKACLLSLRLISPQKNIIYSFNNISLINENNTQAQYTSSVQLNAEFRNVALLCEGTYTVEIVEHLNDNEVPICTETFEVRKRAD